MYTQITDSDDKILLSDVRLAKQPRSRDCRLQMPPSRTRAWNSPAELLVPGDPAVPPRMAVPPAVLRPLAPSRVQKLSKKLRSRLSSKLVIRLPASTSTLARPARSSGSHPSSPSGSEPSPGSTKHWRPASSGTSNIHLGQSRTLDNIAQEGATETAAATSPKSSDSRHERAPAGYSVASPDWEHHQLQCDQRARPESPGTAESTDRAASRRLSLPLPSPSLSPPQVSALSDIDELDFGLLFQPDQTAAEPEQTRRDPFWEGLSGLFAEQSSDESSQLRSDSLSHPPSSCSPSSSSGTIDLLDGSTTTTTTSALPQNMADHKILIDMPSHRQTTSSLTAALRNASLSGEGYSSLLGSDLLAGGQPRDIPAGSENNGSSSMFGPGSVGMSDFAASISGSRPIELRQKPRTESGGVLGAITSGSVLGQAPGSFLNGTSWGMSLGGHFQDLVMAGTSPFATAQSPSFHSNSYLPKMEASHLRDYTCCDLKLDSLHDLIKHYEDQHTAAPSQAQGRPGGRSQQANQSSGSRQQQASQAPIFAAPANSGFDQFQPFSPAQFGGRADDPFSHIDDTLDMEMDDAPPINPMANNGASGMTPGRFDLGMGLGNHHGHNHNQLGHSHHSHQHGHDQFNPGNSSRNTSGTATPIASSQTFRTSHSNTGMSIFPPLQNNPTVSSVNTPTFGPSGGFSSENGADGSAKRQDGSATTTAAAAAAAAAAAVAANQANQPFGHFGLHHTPHQPSGLSVMTSALGSTAGTAVNSAYATATNSRANSPGPIPSGGAVGVGPSATAANWRSNANTLLNRLSGWQLSIPREMEMTLAKHGFTIEHLQYAMVIRQARTDQNLAQKIKDLKTSGVSLGTLGMIFAADQESKPFKCPVVGCEKTYKNQNGLKYHRQHGHVNQKLQKNVDGTFSIVDPETSAPYPGTIGMEKEKPYRCEVCGKRYKNLNGLKYHRQHQAVCNPDFKAEIATALDGFFFVPPELEALAMSLIPPGSETEYIMAGLNAPAEGGVAPADMLKTRPEIM